MMMGLGFRREKNCMTTQKVCHSHKNIKNFQFLTLTCKIKINVKGKRVKTPKVTRFPFPFIF
jgi:hypothetical protein